MSNPGTLAPGGFIETKEYRRFAEFCDAVRRYRYIGLCYGPAGVGKTLSVRYYARWDLLEPLLRDYMGILERPPEAGACRTLFYTPVVGATPRRLADELHQLSRMFNAVVQDALHPDGDGPTTPERSRTELVLVDEADRLGVQALEQLRDFYDRSHFGLVLIGMPGIETRLARYAQLYSRVRVFRLSCRTQPDEVEGGAAPGDVAQGRRDVGRAGGPQQRQHHVAQGGQHLRRRTGAHPARILPQRHIPDVVQPVLDAPMPPRDGEQRCW